MAIEWLKRGRGSLFGREGMVYHVLHNYEEAETGYTGNPHIITCSLKEAVTNYTDAIAAHMHKEMLEQFGAHCKEGNSGQIT